MTRREKVLASAVVAAGAMWGAAEGLKRYRDAVADSDRTQHTAQEALTDAQIAMARGQRAYGKLNDLRKFSLPTNREIAKSLYQDWVRAQLREAGVDVDALTDKPLARARNPSYSELSLDVRGTASLEQLTDFLHRFYSAPHLHRVSTATLTPSEGKLSLALGIDALILPDARRSDALPDASSRELPRSLEEHRASLASRNMFVAHDAAASASTTDDAGQARLSFIFNDGDELVMIVRIAGQSKNMRFRVGDDLEIGSVKGQVVEIGIRRAVIETDDGKLEIRLGQSLAQGAKLDS